MAATSVKLLIVLPNLAMGGAERVMVNLANYWSRNNSASVSIALLRLEGPLLNLVDPSVKILSLCPLKRGPFLFNAVYSFFRLCILMRGMPGAAVLSTLVGTNVLVAAAHFFSQSGARLVLREACTSSQCKFSARLWLAKLFYPRAGALVAVSSDVKQELIDIHGVQPEKISVINNPVDFEIIARQASLRHQQLFSGSAPTLVAIGRFVRQKGFDVLLEAFKEVTGSIDCKLVIVGDGVERGKLAQQITDLGLSNHVYLTGVLDNPYPLLKTAALFVSSSRWEGFPNVILEAMALDRYIVATGCIGLVGTIPADLPGITLVKVDDAHGLAIAICAKLRLSSARSNYTEFLKQFKISYVAKSYADLIFVGQ